MSKEQTPIEWLVMKLQKEWTLGDRDNYLISLALEKEQEHTQAKVLEALEVVKTLTDNNVSVTSEHIDNLIRSKTKV